MATSGVKNSKKKKNLTYEAYQDVREMIFSEELKPGSKIPYRRMAERLNMSLTPLIQALKHMEFMGLVTHNQNRGFFVSEVNPKEIKEAFKLRMLLEIQMLTETMTKIDDQGVAKLRAALENYLNFPPDGPSKVRLVNDIQFHMTLAQLSGETLSIFILRYLFDFLYLRIGNNLVFSRPFEDAGGNHAAIFDSIEKRDAPRAVETLKNHLQKIYDMADQDLQEKASPPKRFVF